MLMKYSWLMALSLEIDRELFDRTVAPVLLAPSKRQDQKNPDHVLYSANLESEPCPMAVESTAWVQSMAEELISQTGIDEPAAGWFESPSGWDLLYLFLEKESFSSAYHVTVKDDQAYDLQFLINSGKDDPMIAALEDLDIDRLGEVLKAFKVAP